MRRLPHGLDSLPVHPSVEVPRDEPHARSSQFHKGYPPFLNEPPDEPLRTAERGRRSSNVQKWPTVGNGACRSFTSRDRWVVSPTGHGATTCSNPHP